YDSSLKSDIARIYYRQYRAEGKLPLLKQASRYNQSEYGQEYARASLENGMDVSPSEWKERAKEAKEYLSEQEILEFSVDYYTRKWGEPQKVVLDDDEWKKACEVNKDDKISYLSLYEFDTNAGGNWKRAVVDCYGYTFYAEDEEGGGVYFKKANNSTVVYYWKKEN
ncbi:MAG TPA: hypothetical protein VKO42_03070, partial [Patescibacteria group bacterium]|nr:hypothetical protein [Patescibacteria group bacterium]